VEVTVLGWFGFGLYWLVKESGQLLSVLYLWDVPEMWYLSSRFCSQTIQPDPTAAIFVLLSRSWLNRVLWDWYLTHCTGIVVIQLVKTSHVLICSYEMQPSSPNYVWYAISILQWVLYTFGGKEKQSTFTLTYLLCTCCIWSCVTATAVTNTIQCKPLIKDTCMRTPP